MTPLEDSTSGGGARPAGGRGPTFRTGIDVVEIARLARSLRRSGEAFEARVFTPGERQRAAASRDPVACLATVFAAKEACFKAIGLPFDSGFDWLSLDVDAAAAHRAATVVCRGSVAESLGKDRLLLSVGRGRHHVIAFAMRVSAASHPEIA